MSTEMGVTQRQEFGATQIQRQAETASTAIAAQAQASVQARYIMALQRPRDWDEVRRRVLRECERTGFAKVARYRKPVGGYNKDGTPKTVDGLSIRFAEAALRCMTNAYPETIVTYEDEQKRILRVTLTDLEANVTYSKDIIVAKVVERSSLKEGQTCLAQRINSKGKPVFLVEATDDELLNKQNALESKALRGHVLRILPGDIADECEDKIIATVKSEIEKDPDSERKKILDAFSAFGVTPPDLKAYLGRDLSVLTPADLIQLRALYTAIKDGETTWTAVMEGQGQRAKGIPTGCA
jgi:hypothetical protein